MLDRLTQIVRMLVSLIRLLTDIFDRLAVVESMVTRIEEVLFRDDDGGGDETQEDIDAMTADLKASNDKLEEALSVQSLKI